MHSSCVFSALPQKGAAYVVRRQRDDSIQPLCDRRKFPSSSSSQHSWVSGWRANQLKPANEWTKASPPLVLLSERGRDAGDKGWRRVWTAGFSAWAPSTHAGIRDRLPDGRFVWILRWASRASPITADLQKISSYFEENETLQKYSRKQETIKNQNCLSKSGGMTQMKVIMWSSTRVNRATLRCEAQKLYMCPKWTFLKPKQTEFMNRWRASAWNLLIYTTI